MIYKFVSRLCQMGDQQLSMYIKYFRNGENLIKFQVNFRLQIATDLIFFIFVELEQEPHILDLNFFIIAFYRTRVRSLSTVHPCDLLTDYGMPRNTNLAVFQHCNALFKKPLSSPLSHRFKHLEATNRMLTFGY